MVASVQSQPPLAARRAVPDLPFWKTLVLLNGATPLALLACDALRGRLGANATSNAIHTTGMLALIFLMLTLTITPLRRLTGWSVLIAFRRALGLFAFFYACLHLAIYFVFDRALDLAGAFHELQTRTYLQIGFIALLLMTPLALTSTNAMIARLGARRWKRLHRLVYFVTGLAVIHFYMQVKSDVRLPLAFAVCFAGLLAMRMAAARSAGRTRSPSPLSLARVPDRKFWKGELKIERIVEETPQVRTLRLVAPGGGPLPFEHQPGQYLNLQLEIGGRTVRRSYTIASPPTRAAYCEVTIKREDMGLASAHIHRALRPGDRLRVAAPAGRFVFAGHEAASVVLIAAGVGVTPMMSIARHLTDRAWPGEIFFFFVARTEADIIFKDELERLRARFPNFRLFVTLTRADPAAWTGRHGRISAEWLVQSVPDLAHRLCYICGPEEMILETRRILASLGVPGDRVKTEAFVSPDAQSAGSGAALADEIIAAADPATAPAPGLPTATFARSGKIASMGPETTILEAGESAGLALPYECRSGICGQCKLKLLAGAAVMEVEDALTPAEKSAGWVLACQAHATADVVVDA